MPKYTKPSIVVFRRELNGHVIYDVTWPRKVKLVTPIRLPNISKTARDAIQQQSLITRLSAVRQ